MEIIYQCDTKCLGLAQNVYQFLAWPKKCGPAQNILRPVEGRGIRPVHDAETNYHLKLSDFYKKSDNLSSFSCLSTNISVINLSVVLVRYIYILVRKL